MCLCFSVCVCVCVYACVCVCFLNQPYRENLRKAGKERRENYSELLGLRPTLSSQSGEIKRGQIGQDVLPTLHGTH